MAYHGKKKGRHRGVRTSLFGQIFKHHFPAADGMKPGPDGWESVGKPEKTLGKRWHRQGGWG